MININRMIENLEQDGAISINISSILKALKQQREQISAYKTACDACLKMIQNHQVDMAEQQLFGWNESKRGVDLISLVSNMGLTKKEWKQLLDEEEVDYLIKLDKSLIEAYLEDKND